MSPRIGFRTQRDPGTCGQRSLIHALLLLNHPISEQQAFIACGVTRKLVNVEGTDEKELIRAIKHFGYRHSILNTRNRRIAKQFLNSHLGSGHPIIISVEEEDHWAVLARMDGAKYVWIDSTDDRLIGKWGIADVLDWMKCNTGYYAIAIKPRL